jgi:hypothetical protein
MYLPIARSERLSIRELPDEVLVFDSENNKAHCLNATVALVWRHCDGERSVAALARIVEQHLHVMNAEPVVELALEQLGRRNLLVEAPAPAPALARLSRREALKKMVAAAIAIPLVMTVTAKAVAATVLGSKVGDPCSAGPNHLQPCATVLCYGCQGSVVVSFPAECVNGHCACTTGSSTPPNCQQKKVGCQSPGIDCSVETPCPPGCTCNDGVCV